MLRTTGAARRGGRPYKIENHNHRANSVPGGTIVASRSGPVEIIPISTCRNSEINRKYASAALVSFLPSFTPSVFSHHPVSVLYSGVTFSYSSAGAGISLSGLPLYLYPTQT